MTPRSLVPVADSIPFDDLVQGHLYRWKLRWLRYPPPCAKLGSQYYTMEAVFVGLCSRGRGEQIGCDVMYADGTGSTLYRAQILRIDHVK